MDLRAEDESAGFAEYADSVVAAIGERRGIIADETGRRSPASPQPSPVARGAPRRVLPRGSVERAPLIASAHPGPTLTLAPLCGSAPPFGPGPKRSNHPPGRERSPDSPGTGLPGFPGSRVSPRTVARVGVGFVSCRRRNENGASRGPPTRGRDGRSHRGRSPDGPLLRVPRRGVAPGWRRPRGCRRSARGGR